MTIEELEARLEAIQYIIVNDLYSHDMEEEVFTEVNELEKQIEALKSNNDDSNDILEQRREQYGDYDTFVSDMRNLLNILSVRKSKDNPNIYTVEDIENFFFVLKLLRLQTAKDIDSVKDLEGYAKLSKERRERSTQSNI